MNAVAWFALLLVVIIVAPLLVPTRKPSFDEHAESAIEMSRP